ncbi:hypothetical protein, partial [Acetobacter sicerae]|uniref:hypothetical protein n=1 Tax=Acetobacter sicerae TaxID=85325 RepID=UPI00156B6B75
LVVMLPLTDEQWRAANAAPYARDKGPMPAIEASIRAIGTPVDSSVPVACWGNAKFQQMLDETDQHRMTVSDERSEYFDTPYVRQSDHLAALEEKQDEVERLREAFRVVIAAESLSMPATARAIAREALAGAAS